MFSFRIFWKIAMHKEHTYKNYKYHLENSSKGLILCLDLKFQPKYPLGVEVANVMVEEYIWVSRRMLRTTEAKLHLWCFFDSQRDPGMIFSALLM